MTRRILLAGAAFPLALMAAGEDAARKDAEKWLALVDNGRYRDAYKSASRHSRSQATAEEWEAQIRVLHEAVGAPRQRTFSSAKPSRSLPGAPDGEYMILEFSTAFEKKEKAVETLMMSRESGAWKAAGYFIH
jgi:hypothetical protein